MKPKIHYDSWKEFQDSEVSFFEYYIKLLKEAGLVEYYFENWEAVKKFILQDSQYALVNEKFTYDLETWLQEIYVRVKPFFVKLLEDYSKSKDAEQYKEYINNFFTKQERKMPVK